MRRGLFSLPRASLKIAARLRERFLAKAAASFWTSGASLFGIEGLRANPR
jgi:hypothetical protein